MDISIQPILHEKIPGFKVAAISYRNIIVDASPQMLKGRLQLFQESLFFETQEKEIMDFAGLKEWRDTFKLAGTDAARYRHSAEALYRRIKKQNYLPSIHSATDLNNFFSLQYECPIGIYDCEAVKGNITLAIGNENDEYEGINERMNSLKNMILTKDEIGPFGSPYVDSKRTMVTPNTKNAIQFIYLRPSLSREEAEQLTQSLMNMFISICGGDASYKIYS
ncbi:B3/B4 domain-containing protein [Bacillus massiliigorillae]|uniref:B3/B4 domain-containing protein n=1 Tax=Bacillus massiliigorillae TaxID=1243664 RepID=UPI0003A49231|nr:phenylalanine--tRNA ligase beta subunit-related protein [Bacillus massiliigorillae]